MRSITAGQIRFEVVDATLSVYLSGEFDVANVDELVDVVVRAASDNATGVVELDLAEVTFIDSSFIRMVLSCERGLNDNGSHLALRRPPPAVRRVFEVTGLTYMLEGS